MSEGLAEVRLTPLPLTGRNATCPERETCGAIQTVNSPRADTGQISNSTHGRAQPIRFKDLFILGRFNLNIFWNKTSHILIG